MLWVLLLSVPFPYIATTAGWWTAELGRQPWLIYGLFRTANGSSAQVGAGDVVFTTLGFAGLYLALGMLFVFQVQSEISRGPRGKRPPLVEAPNQVEAPPAARAGSQLVAVAGEREAMPTH
jgi:cytochrome d ubiquinol oxidase subunit I